MKKAIMFFVFIIFLSGISFAEEKTQEIILEPGYKFYSVNKNPSLADEYSSTKSSPSLKFSIKDYSDWYKYNIKLNVNEYDDYDFDIHWYYKEKVRLELSGVYFDHDLGFKSNTSFVNLSPDMDFIVKYRNQKAEIKYKPFIEPFHVKLNVEKIEKEGNIQKRFLGSSSSNPSYNGYEDIFSLKAPINYVTNIGGIALDGLLGGVNLFFAVTRSTFNDDAKRTDDGVMNVPEISEGTYSLKLTSNQSGKISYALSFSRIDRDNDSRDELGQRGAKSGYNNSNLLLSYYPFRQLKLSFKAAYEDYEQDNVAKWRYLNSDYSVQQPINYIKRTLSVKGRYDISKSSYLMAEVKGKEIEKTNTLNEIPDTSRQTSSKIELGSALNEALQFKITQFFEKNSEPTYKDRPENISKTSFNANYNISDSSGLDIDAFYAYETNSNLTGYFVENRIKGIDLTFYYLPNESLVTHLYAGIEMQDYKSDLEFGKSTSAGYFVIRTPYEAKTLQIGVNANKKLGVKQELYGNVFYLRGYGTYDLPTVSGVVGSYLYDTNGLDKLSQVDFYQYGLLIGTKYKVSNKDNLKCEVSYKDHEEKSDNLLSGAVKAIFVAWERKW